MSTSLFKNPIQNGMIEYVILHKKEKTITIYQNPKFFQKNKNIIVTDPFGYPSNPIFNAFLGYLQERGKLPGCNIIGDGKVHDKLHNFIDKNIHPFNGHTHFSCTISTEETLKKLAEAINEYENNIGLRQTYLEKYYQIQGLMSGGKMPSNEAIKKLASTKIFDQALMNEINAQLEQTNPDKANLNSEGQKQSLKKTGRDLLSIEESPKPFRFFPAVNTPSAIERPALPAPTGNSSNQVMLASSMFIPGVIAAVVFIMLVYKLYQLISPKVAAYSDDYGILKKGNNSERIKTEVPPPCIPRNTV